MCVPYLQKVLVVDVSQFCTGSQSTKHRFQQGNMLTTKQLHLLFEGLTHRDTHGQSQFRPPPQIGLPPAHFRITSRFIRTIARSSILRWSHATTFAAPSSSASCWCYHRAIQCVIVAKKADKIVLGMLVLEGGAQITRDSSLQAAIAGKSVQVRRPRIARRVHAQLPHCIRLIREDTAQTAARG